MRISGPHYCFDNRLHRNNHIPRAVYFYISDLCTVIATCADCRPYQNDKIQLTRTREIWKPITQEQYEDHLSMEEIMKL